MFEIFNERKFLLKQLVKRDLTSKYKESVLGVIWSFVKPLCVMLIFTAIFSVLFRFQIKNFPVYLLSIFLWVAQLKRINRENKENKENKK